MVNQVQVVAILMIVNGALVSLMGLLYTAMGPTLIAFMKLAPATASSPYPQTDTTFMTVMSVFYLTLGLLVLTAGILNIVGGIRSLKLRGRTFAIVALFSNLAPLFTCYCLATSLPLMIYGLIVFFQADVAHAFAMVAAGAPPERFTRPRRRYDEEEMEEEEFGEEDADDEIAPRAPAEPGDNIQLGPNERIHRPPEE